MKKKYYFYGILALIVLFVAYNYYSASQAETNITKIIQEQVDKPNEAISIQFASVDVSPFAGNIRFNELNIIQPGTVKKVKKLTFDLRYIDFLKFNFGGVKYGLKHLSAAHIILKKLTLNDQKNSTKISFDQLLIEYTGTLWDAIQAYFTPKKASQVHTITAIGKRAAYKKTASALGNFTVDSLYIHHTFATPQSLEPDPLNSVYLDSITWVPPKSFQQKYAFFIKGFGFAADSIAFGNLGFSYLSNNKRIKITDGDMQMTLFTTSFYGKINKQPVPAFRPLHISITELSPQLKTVLQNLTQMFNLRLPLNKKGGIEMRLIGPVSNPRVVF